MPESYVNIDDWQQEAYDDYENIAAPENTAYIIEINTDRHWGKTADLKLKEFTAISKDPRIGELQALILKVNSNNPTKQANFAFRLSSRFI